MKFSVAEEIEINKFEQIEIMYSGTICNLCPPPGLQEASQQCKAQQKSLASNCEWLIGYAFVSHCTVADAYTEQQDIERSNYSFKFWKYLISWYSMIVK